MPELPEVERARKLIQDSCTGYTIDSIDSVPDSIVYCGGYDHLEFAKEIRGREITGCQRKGKQFWMTLSGDGKLPVMHFGMTGMIQLKGQEPTWYRRRPKESSDVWPPRFYKFILKLSHPTLPEMELAFIDPRRLGRLRLVPSPVLAHPPLSALGFDPVLDHPTLDQFKALVEKKKGTVKGLIMDQAFSAGVGNWVADEVLYQARIHPACPVPALSEQDISELHRQLRAVPLAAIAVNADSTQFPEDWLFRWRWDKGRMPGGGKKAKAAADDEGIEDVKPKGKEYLALPNGAKATIAFIEIGGRTTAVVTELQKLPKGIDAKPKVPRGKQNGGPGGGKTGTISKRGKKRKGQEDSESDLTDLTDEEVVVPTKTTSRQRAKIVKSEPTSVKLQPRGKRETR